MLFQRDLRVADHPALALALSRGAVLPVYLVDLQVWRQPDRSARQLEFVAECLAELHDDLAALGLPLAIRSGSAPEVLDRLCRLHGIAEIVSTLPLDMQDHGLRAWARTRGIRWLAAPPVPAEAELPAVRAVAGVEPGPLPRPRALGLRDDPCPHRQRGGRQAGQALLDSFLASRGEGYCAAQTAPLLAERGSSRLSPYLAQGVLSRAEVDRAVAARLAARPGGDWSAGLHRFRSRLALPQPPAATGPSGFMPSAGPGSWLAGETGLPFLDACLRQLRATGWLDMRLRELVVTSAVWLFGLDEAGVGAALARRLTDYDPAILWPEMARLGRQPPPRLVNPVAAGLRFDPEGRFIRRWLPELAPVPEPLLHTPWRWSGARGLLGRTYPEPLVDPATALRVARLACPRPARPPRRTGPDVLIEGPPRRAAAGQLCLDL